MRLDLTDLHVILPDIIVKSKRDLEFSGKIVQDSVILALNLKTGTQSLSVNVRSTNRKEILENRQSKGIEFQSKIEINNFMLENWFNLDVPVQFAAGKIHINGWFENLAKHNLEIKGSLEDLKYQSYSSDSLNLQAQMVNGEFKSIILINSKDGRFNIKSEIERFFSDPKILAQASIRNLNLRNILHSNNIALSDLESGNEPLQKIETDLNLDIQFAYSDPSGIDEYSYIDLTLFDSRFDDYKIELFNSHLQFKDSLYILDSLFLQTQFADLLLVGSGNFNGYNDLDYIIRTRDLRTLGPILNIDFLNADGNFYGSLRGELSSLTNRINVDLKNVQYNSITLDSVTGEAEAILKNDQLLWEGNAVLSGINLNGQHFQELRFNSAYNNRIISSEIEFLYTPNIYGSFSANIVPDSILTIDLPQIDFKFRDENWTGSLEDLIYNPDLQTIDLDDFNLVCLNCDDNRSINAQGILAMHGYQKFSTRINDVDLNLILNTFGIEADYGGRIDMDLDLSGTMQNPIFEGTVSVEEGNANDLKFRELYCSYEYGDDRLLIDLTLDLNESDSLTVDGSLPLHISMTDTLPLFNEDAGFEININSTPMPLSLLLAADYNFETLEGKLICNMHVGNTFSNPSFDGELLIKDGRMKIPYWGIDYQNINMELFAEKDRFVLKKFEVSRDAGKLIASGSMQLDFASENESIMSSDLKLIADKFFIVQHKDFELQVSSEMQYSEKAEGPRIGGEVDIIRSNFYLPSVMARIGGITTGSEDGKPLLVKAKEAQAKANIDDTDLPITLNVKDTLSAPEFLDLLEGDIVVKLNGNTWIRDPQLRVELEGNLNMKFSEGQVSLLGPIRTVRGQYDVLGRRFIVVEGLVEFQGRQNANIPIKSGSTIRVSDDWQRKTFSFVKGFW